jgi:hypothetical protein
MSGLRYPANVSEFARRLYEEGRTVPEVRAALARRGLNPTRSTVLYWCRPDAREAHNFRNRHRRYPAGRQRQQEMVWWAKYKRLRELRDAGLSYSAIAKLATLDFGADLSADQARYMLQNNGATAPKVLA